jgi:molybdenum cofactor guanylyltransferase
VLAGGRARRFGSEKLVADLDGIPLLHHALRVVAQVCDEVVLVAAAGGEQPRVPDDLPVPLIVVPDPTPHPGPLRALLVGAGAATRERLLVVGGDMPRLQPALLDRLLGWPADKAGSVLLLEGGSLPLPLGLAQAAVLGAAGERLERGERSLRALVRHLDLEQVPEDEWRILDPAALSLQDVDTPEDLARLSGFAPGPGEEEPGPGARVGRPRA